MILHDLQDEEGNVHGRQEDSVGIVKATHS